MLNTILNPFSVIKQLFVIGVIFVGVGILSVVSVATGIFTDE